MLCSNLHSFWIAGKIDKKLPGTHVVRTNVRVYTPELKLAFTLLHSAIVILYHSIRTHCYDYVCVRTTIVFFERIFHIYAGTYEY